MIGLFRTRRETISLPLTPTEIAIRLKGRVDLSERMPATWAYRRRSSPDFWGAFFDGGFRFLHRPLPGVQSAIVEGRVTEHESGSEIRLSARVDRRNQVGIILGLATFFLLIHLKARVFILMVIPLLLFSAWRLKRDRDAAFEKMKDYLRGR